MNYMDEVLLEGPEEAPDLVCLIHGWPDDLHMWDSLVGDLLRTGKYRCLRITLPGYGDKLQNLKARLDNFKSLASKWIADIPSKGWQELPKSPSVCTPNFHEAAQLIAEVIEQNRKGQEQVTLIAHDWGSVTSIQLQRQFPSLVKRMVLLDVGPIDNFSAKAYFVMGAYYQWANQLAYLFWRYVPLIGQPFGNWLHRTQIRRFKTETWNKVPRDQSAHAAYYYHYFQKDYWLQWIGRKSQVVDPPAKGKPNPSCPTLFLYGSTGLGKAFKAWYQDLQARAECDVLAIPGNHWFLLKSPEKTNAAVIEWLALAGGGKLLSRL